MNEVPEYEMPPTADPTTAGSHSQEAGKGAERLLSGIQKGTLQVLDECDALTVEVGRYVDCADVSLARFEPILSEIDESTQQVRSRLDDRQWVYPDGSLPREWQPHYLDIIAAER